MPRRQLLYPYAVTIAPTLDGIAYGLRRVSSARPVSRACNSLAIIIIRIDISSRLCYDRV
jgi:hypothetical protein